MTKVDRQPAVRRPEHPAADLPARTRPPATPPPATDPPESTSTPTPPGRQRAKRGQSAELPTPPPYPGGEKLSTVLATRVRPSTDARVRQVLDELPRAWSIQALTDLALTEFMDRYELGLPE